MINFPQLVKGTLLATSPNPRLSVMEVLNKFTILTGWPIWPPTEHKSPEQIKAEQVFVLDFVSDKLIQDYPRVTIEMFEKAICEMATRNIAFERKPAQLFFMLDEWLIEHNDEIYAARKAPDENAPKLPERTESQKQQDRIDLFVTLYELHKSGDRIMGGWSTPYQILKENGIHVPDAAINSELWALVRSNKKRGFVEALKSPVESERNEARLAVDNWDRWMDNNESSLHSDYQQAICRHYFDLLGDEILDLIK